MATVIVLTADIEKRFWAKVGKRDVQNCWSWLAAKDRYGYGQIGIGGRKLASSHRVMWTIWYGEIPAGLQVLHRCDNPQCCNPSHLFLGTQADNLADRNAKGRHGRRGPGYEIAPEWVMEVRKRFAAGGISKMALAREYQVSSACIFDIIKYRSWRKDRA